MLNTPKQSQQLDASWLAAARSQIYTDLVDLRLSGYQAALGFARRIDTRLKHAMVPLSEPGWAVLAIGGYGRCELAPQSDVDLLFLINGADETAVAPLRSQVLQLLWDAGLKVGHGTRSLVECATLAAMDPTVATAHADARHLAGDTRLAATLVRQSVADLQRSSANFLSWLRQDLVRRHKRYGDTVYYLEPNLKLGEGGLRDAQSANWAAMVALGCAARPSGGTNDPIPTRIVGDLIAGHDFLLKVRAILHLETGFRGDRLTFEAQEKVAKSMGYMRGSVPDTRRLMQETYRHCQRVFRATERILDICEAQTTAARPPTAEVQLPAPFVVQGGYLSTSIEINDPNVALALLSLRTSTGLPIHPDIQDQLQCRASQWNWTNIDLAPFWNLLTRPDRSEILFDLHHSGILSAIIPEFLTITGLFQRNIFHIYTVDIHSLHAVAALKRLLGKVGARPPGDQPENAFAAESDNDDRVTVPPTEKWSLSCLFQELSDYRPLFLATLLHDIGKGARETNPGCSSVAATTAVATQTDQNNGPAVIPPAPTSGFSPTEPDKPKHTRSVEQIPPKPHNPDSAVAAQAALRLGLTESQSDDVAFLVKRHLDMAVLSQQRDLSDVAMIRAFSREVGSVHRLIQLTLLTYADMAAVHPDFLTQWREALLVKLYQKARIELELGEFSDPDEANRLESIRISVLRHFFDDSPDIPTPRWRPIERFLGDMPRAYLLSTPPETIARHVHVLQQRGDSPVYVAKHALPEPGLLEIIVVTQDKPGLLLLISGVMASCGLDIVGADVISRSDGSVIDVFTVSDPHGDLITDTRRMSQLDTRLSAAMDGQLDVDQLVRQELNQSRLGPRPVPQLQPEVTIDSTVSRTFTVIDVSCTDQRALLYRIAKTLTDLGLTIGLSRVSTVGHEARDTFYVTYISGEKIIENQQLERIRQSLVKRLSTPLQQI